MNRTLLAVGVAALIALAGCSGLPGGDQADAENDAALENDTAAVAVQNDTAGATSVNHSLAVEVNESAAGQELTAIGATYPREDFEVESAQHEEINVSVDTNGDGEADQRFGAAEIGGANNNEYSFDISLETGYTLQEGDVVTITYPAVDSPTEPGEYEVEIRLNDEQTSTANLTIE